MQNNSLLYNELTSKIHTNRRAKVSIGLLQEEKSDYETAFLQPLNIGDRKGVFISKKTQEEIAEIVYVAAAGKLTIGAFVEHILRHHLEIHQDEIDALFEQQFHKRFER